MDPAPIPAALQPRAARRFGLRPLLALVVIAVLGAGVWMWRDRNTGPAAPSYSTEEVVRGDVVSRVSATGTLSPVVTVEVGSQVSGRVTKLHADYNTEVKAGDVIAEIDPLIFKSAVAQAKARLISARADFNRAKALAENARIQHERAARLVPTGAIAKSDLDTAIANLRTAEAQIESSAAEVTVAKAALEQAETNLTYTTILSPIDGVVVSRNVDVGQTVAAAMSAPVLYVIAEDLRKMEVHTSVAESDVGQVREGMKVSFTVDAYPGEVFAGEVKQVRYEAVSVSNVVTYDAVVAVANDDLKLRPGMTANVDFVAAEARDVLTVPTRALAYRPADAPRRRPGGDSRGPMAMAEGSPRQDRPGSEAEAGAPGGAAQSATDAPNAAAGGQRSFRERRGERKGGRPRSVWVLRNGKPERVRVELGLSDGSVTEIKEGDLAEGDAVIVGDDRPAASSDDASRGGNRRRRGPPRIL